MLVYERVYPHHKIHMMLHWRLRNCTKFRLHLSQQGAGDLPVALDDRLDPPLQKLLGVPMYPQNLSLLDFFSHWNVLKHMKIA